MAKLQSNEKTSGKGKGKLNSSGLKGRVKKQKQRKKKSIHANTFEERQENRRKKEEIKQNKEKNKQRRDASRALSSKVIHEVTTWARNNPLHPSIVPKPTQQGIRSIGPFSRDQKTYKSFLKCLPHDVTPQEIDDHFYRRKNVQINSIKLLVHRKTEHCLGMGFLEFNDKLEYEKSLTQNFTLLKGKRIVVEQSLRTFVPSKRKPQKIITYIPPKKLGPWKTPESILEKEKNEDEIHNEDEIQIIEELKPEVESEKELQTSEGKNKIDENKTELVEMELGLFEKDESVLEKEGNEEIHILEELKPEGERQKELQISEDKKKVDENKDEVVEMELEPFEKKNESILEREGSEDENQIIKELEPEEESQKKLQTSEDTNKVMENKDEVVEMELEPFEKPESLLEKEGSKDGNQIIKELEPEEESQKKLQSSEDNNEVMENKTVFEMDVE